MKQEPFEAGGYYHVFNRGNNKENIFKENKNYSHFLNLMKKYLLTTCNIYGYCLLPNHFHWLIQIKNLDELPADFAHGKIKISLPFANLFNAYTKAINKKYHRTGSLFQEHLHRIKIENEAYFRELVLYIHLNPENHGIVSDFSHYNHSSYKAYISQSNTALARSEVIPYFGDLENMILVHKHRQIRMEILKGIDETET
ncbi:MAG: hypothetical protein WCX31_05160 [Salinivirgaceae bacterium]|jgi:REP element-mobilizing transposase RayT